MFYQWPKIPKNLTFKNFLHYNWAFGSCQIHTFIHISKQGVCNKNLGPKNNNLDIIYESLNFFFLMKQSLDFFQRFGKNP
jgi:hypothetical protein